MVTGILYWVSGTNSDHATFLHAGQKITLYWGADHRPSHGFDSLPQKRIWDCLRPRLQQIVHAFQEGAHQQLPLLGSIRPLQRCWTLHVSIRTYLRQTSSSRVVSFLACLPSNELQVSLYFRRIQEAIEVESWWVRECKQGEEDSLWLWIWFGVMC